MFKTFDRYQALKSNRQLVVLTLAGLALNVRFWPMCIMVAGEVVGP